MIKNKARFALFIGIVIAIGVGIYYITQRQKETGVKKITSGIKTDSKADLVIAYNTFPGVAGLVYMNEGKEVNENSRFTKLTGLKLQIKQIDKVSDTRDGLKTGELDAAYCTVDALSTEMGSGSELVDLGLKVRLKINESRGADAIVVRKGINNVADLKGKKIAYAITSASHTLLLNTLDINDMKGTDVEQFKVDDGLAAAAAFKSGDVDAAIVWAPDDEDCVKAVPGSKILVTTKTASQIIADGLLVTDKRYAEKREMFEKLGAAWLQGNALMNKPGKERTEGIQLFSTAFGLETGVVEPSVAKIRFSTLGDNKQFFGLDAQFTGMTGQKMYSRMAVKYQELGYANLPVGWAKVADESLVEALSADKSLAVSEQAPDGPAKFTPATETEKTVAASGSKVVSIQFPTGSYQLDEDAKAIIDRQVTNLAQGFAGAKIRIEGNTDNTGNAVLNKKLSLDRANAVRNYLVKEYKFDENKFIVIGNGQSKPTPGCEDNADEACKSKNRRTDFEFIFGN